MGVSSNIVNTITVQSKHLVSVTVLSEAREHETAGKEASINKS